MKNDRFLMSSVTSRVGIELRNIVLKVCKERDRLVIFEAK